MKAEFCVPVVNVRRSVDKTLGGGATLDLGIYCLQFMCMVFHGEKPECIQAMGTCYETGENPQFIFYAMQNYCVELCALLKDHFCSQKEPMKS